MRALSRLVIFVASMLISAPAFAADVEFPSPTTAVNEFGTTTYLDLARHFVPDIKPSDSGYVGSKHISLRHLGGKDYDNTEGDSFGFYDISTVRMKADGQERLLVLFDFAQAAQTAQGLAVLALYDAGKEIKLLDAADIGFDQSTYFFDQGLMPVASDSDVILTMSTHFNSQQTYTTQSMIKVAHDQLQLIDKLFLFNEKLCASDRQQNVRYAANPNAADRTAGRPYAPISVFVTATVTPTGEDCGEGVPEASKDEIRVNYRWDSTTDRYTRDSDALEKLAKANEERF